MSDDTPMEKMRVCPSCRMQISVLATKCRFCGEEVGKPKDESRTLSIHDLGGEHVYHRAPSGSVMEALEAFRVDETLQQSPGGLDTLDLGLDPNQKIPGSGNAPSAFDIDYRPSPPTGTKTSKKPAPKSNTGLIIGAVAAAVVLLVAAVAVPRVIKSINTKPVVTAPVFVNQAPKILQSGGPPLDALTAAVEAIAHDDNAQNRLIAEQCVAALEKQVTEKLNATPFDNDNLNSASSLATRGADLYPNETTRKLVAETKEENGVYKMVLVNIDSATDTAKFKLVDDGDVEVHEKEYVVTRFLVLRIVGRRSVTLVDTKRANRQVMFEVGSLAESVK